MSLLGLFVDITRAHAEIHDYQQASWPEPFQCQNCGFEGALNIHAQCQRCDSNAVFPVSHVK